MVLVVILLIAVVATAVLAWKNPLYFLFAHLLGRFVLDSLPQYTYQLAIAPLTIMQVYSIASIAFIIIYLTLKRGWSFSRLTLSIAAVVLAVLISAIINIKILGFAELGMKWVYLWVLIEYVLYTLRDNEPERVLYVVWFCYMYPLLNQYAFFAIGTPKVDAGNISYLGTFDHESSTAMLLLGLIAISAVLWTRGRSSVLKNIYLFVILAANVGIYFNNYRTALPALAVFWVVFIYYYNQKINIGKRVLVNYGMALVIAAGFIYIGDDIAIKLGDLATVYENIDEEVDFSGHAERSSLLSGRVYLWNMYIYHYLNSGFVNYIVGLGPRSGNELVGVYAHNEFISTLLEYGIFGVVAFLFFLISTYKVMRRSIRLDHTLFPFLAMFLGFMVMSLGTMPFHDPRAMIFMAISIAFCLQAFRVETKTKEDETAGDSKSRFGSQRVLARRRTPR